MRSRLLRHCYIQGVPGGKVNILGGHSIGHSKQKISETVRNRIYVHIIFLLRMTDTITSLNIDLSSWDTLYIHPPKFSLKMALKSLNT